MTGAITWDHLIFIVSVLSAAIVGTAGVLIGVYALLNKERMQTNLKITRLTDRLAEDAKHIDRRMGALEIFHAGLVSVLKQMDEFRNDVKEDFGQLREERKDDMRRLHERLDILSDQVNNVKRR